MNDNSEQTDISTQVSVVLGNHGFRTSQYRVLHATMHLLDTPDSEFKGTAGEWHVLASRCVRQLDTVLAGARDCCAPLKVSDLNEAFFCALSLSYLPEGFDIDMLKESKAIGRPIGDEAYQLHQMVKATITGISYSATSFPSVSARVRYIVEIMASQLAANTLHSFENDTLTSAELLESIPAIKNYQRALSTSASVMARIFHGHCGNLAEHTPLLNVYTGNRAAPATGLKNP